MPLDDETKQFLHGLMLRTYLNGCCYELALALARALDWPIVGLQQIGNDGMPMIRHAAVRHPEGGFFDARGRVSDQTFLTTFGPGIVQEFEIETRLTQATRPVLEHHIHTAGKLAMSCWPELPWIKDTYIRSVVAFLDDLERLSRQHGLWLRASIPVEAPIIASGDGGEVGYALTTIGNGEYSVDRMLRWQADVGLEKA